MILPRSPETASNLLRSDMMQIAPQTGTAIRLSTGEMLTVRDPMGGQVSDFFCFSAADLGESLSSGRTIDYSSSLLLSAGAVLYSNRSNPMVTIVSDTCGRHDFLLTPCSQQTFDLLYPQCEGRAHPSCLDNLARGLSPYGVHTDQIGTTFNIFMNVRWASDGTIVIDPPTSRPGDAIVLRAEMDLYVGLTACSAEKSNGGVCKPIEFRVDPAK